MIKNTLLAQAVVDVLNGKDDWPFKFVAERALVPLKELKEMGETLYVLVAPGGKKTTGDFEPQPIGRKKVRAFYEISVGIMQRVDVENMDLADPLLDFVDEMTVFLEHQSLTVAGTVQVRINRLEQGLVDGEDFLNHQFSSLLRLTLEVVAAI